MTILVVLVDENWWHFSLVLVNENCILLFLVMQFYLTQSI